MEQGFLEKVYDSVAKKEKMLNGNFLNYLVRAMAAGVFLTLIYTFCMQIVSDFNQTEVAPLGKMLMSYLFGIGLIFIIYFGAELFTSNAMYFSLGAGHRKTTILRSTKLLVACWVCNFIGAALCAFILVQTGLFNALADGSYPNDALYSLAAKKANLPWNEIFFRGIMANFVVNIVIFIQAVVKDDVAKLLIVPLGLVPFVYLGFEHSIANFGVFLMTWFTPGAAEAAMYNDAAFTTLGAFNNLLWATLGNLVGGGLLVGGYFGFLHRDKIKKD
ncbi:formate/nitrite transporter family protein [Erysipelotrichaceae bacterium OttesenSCG-928-M19]|nr:formate/nitrite transporter family protein [Erysipelotrichaceae bacterium OttesenSCG-928-M19]